MSEPNENKKTSSDIDPTTGNFILDKEDLFFTAQSPDNGVREDQAVTEQINQCASLLKERGVAIAPWIQEVFQDPDLYYSLPEHVRENQSELASYIENTNHFDSIIPNERAKRWQGDLSGLFGEEVSVAEARKASGSMRPEEKGYKINIEYLRSIDIDPTKVLFYRVTQPSDSPKPEYYWTSDFHEVVRGLTREIGPDQRETAVILVADLNTIHNNEGLIQDINDDNGLAVRQIGHGPFDQKQCMSRFEHTQHGGLRLDDNIQK